MVRFIINLIELFLEKLSKPVYVLKSANVHVSYKLNTAEQHFLDYQVDRSR